MTTANHHMKNFEIHKHFVYTYHIVKIGYIFISGLVRTVYDADQNRV